MGRLARQALEENAREVSLSKALSLLLRHNAVRAGITIRGDGFCLMHEVLEAPDLRILGATAARVEGFVHTSPKQRFELRREEGGFLLRAVQGHSMLEVRDDLLLRSLSVFDEYLPQLCVHGTKERHLTSILLRGLLAGGRRRSRTHVHFQPYRPGDERVVSGMRDGSEIAIYLDLRRALVDGIPFSMSRNNVILSPGIDGVIPPRYIVDVQRLEGLEVSTESVPSTASGSAEGPRDEAQTLAIAERLGVVLHRDEQTPYLGPPTPPRESASTGALPLPVASNRDRLRRIAGRLEILAGLTVDDADIEWLPGSDDCLANLEALTAEIDTARPPQPTRTPPTLSESPRPLPPRPQPHSEDWEGSWQSSSGYHWMEIPSNIINRGLFECLANSFKECFPGWQWQFQDQGIPLKGNASPGTWQDRLCCRGSGKGLVMGCSLEKPWSEDVIRRSSKGWAYGRAFVHGGKLEMLVSDVFPVLIESTRIFIVTSRSLTDQ